MSLKLGASANSPSRPLASSRFPRHPHYSSAPLELQTSAQMSYLARPVASRAIHLKITPRPSNLGESREILRLLSQFGEIDYFKNLKYDGQGLGLPSVSLVIYKDDEGAKKCFQNSPVRFRMGRVRPDERKQNVIKEEVQQTKPVEQERAGDRGGAWGLGDGSPSPSLPFGLEPEPQRQRRYSSTSSLPHPTPRPIRMPFDPPSPADTEAEAHEDKDRFFQIHTSISRRDFRAMADMNHYHGSFAIDSKMPGQPDLAKRVPMAGLSCVDWRGKERPLRFVQADKEGRCKGERLGMLWEKGRQGNAGTQGGANVDALGAVEEFGLGREKKFGGKESFRRKWGFSWSDIGIN